MATRKWHSEDGTHFDTKAEADAYEASHSMLRQVEAIANRSPKEILAWFEENFRVPKKRQPRKPRNGSPAGETGPIVEAPPSEFAPPANPEFGEVLPKASKAPK